jgi:antitoxin component YwqK of YwqJK toxin-antitoxin module
MPRLLLASFVAVLVFLARTARAEETLKPIPPGAPPIDQPVDPPDPGLAAPSEHTDVNKVEDPELRIEPVLANELERPLTPAVEDSGDASKQAEDNADSSVETIRERYPNRVIKIEREVTRDANDNYVNHGAWRMWDRQGEMISKGEHRHGKRHGEWTAWFVRGEAKLLNESPFDKFESPFTSVVNFTDGQMNGTWTISDSKQRKVAEWHYLAGARHGTWTYWYLTGSTMRAVEYRSGLLHGELKEWDESGKVLRVDQFVQGRRVGTRVEHFKNQQKKSEGTFLFAQMIPDGPDDWWNLSVAPFKQHGDDQKHGILREWYPNGQVRLQGEYESDQPKSNTMWSWWYANGQKAVEGMFAGGEKHGRWIWWHENGQKKVEGYFENSQPSQNWIWWKDNGIVAKRADFSVQPPKASTEVKSEQLGTPGAPLAESAGLPVPAVRVASPLSNSKSR